MELALVSVVIFLGLLFTYTNGFHDTANAIATVVGTKVLTPRQAIMLAAVTTIQNSRLPMNPGQAISSRQASNGEAGAHRQQKPKPRTSVLDSLTKEVNGKPHPS